MDARRSSQSLPKSERPLHLAAGGLTRSRRSSRGRPRAAKGAAAALLRWETPMAWATRHQGSCQRQPRRSCRSELV
eukprot:11819971-Alexandrium_andersonii.AAC.1